MMEIVTKDKFATTKLLTNSNPDNFVKNGIKCKYSLFLPSHPERKGEGGLRKKGFFKYNYQKHENTWYATDFEGNEICSIKLPLERKGNIYNQISELPIITVITTVYNGGDLLEKTILSVINQTYPNVEYLIIDGGSTDNTLDIIKQYEDHIDYWVSEPDKGIYDGMNKGIKLSLGKWINFMNCGDVFDNPNTLKELFFDKITKYQFNNYDVIYGDFTLINEKGEKFKTLPSDHNLLTKMDSHNYICHQSSFVKTTSLKHYQFLPFTYSLDLDLWLRMLNDKRQFLHIKQVISNYLVGGVTSNFNLRLKVFIEHRLIKIIRLKKFNVTTLAILLFESLIIKLKIFLKRCLGTKGYNILKRIFKREI